jgi:alkane 1-monooxygenase
MKRLDWVPYLLAFVMPIGTLAFLSSVPHRWYAAPLLALLVLVLGALDGTSRAAATLAQPRRGPRFDAILISLVGLQLANVAIFVAAMRRGIASWEAAPAILMMGVTTGYSAIVVGHELIHRRGVAWRGLGRVLLWTGLYDHFYVEHLRGHHVRLASGTDYAPARFGESFWRFALRSLPGELVSAWRISAVQTGLGAAIEIVLAATLAVTAGPWALVAFLVQAAIAGLLITAVNYFQHWGVGRSSKRMRAGDAWDCDSALTHYALLGISRHADHHLHAGRTYPELRPSAASPKLPHGYLRMVALVIFRSRRARELLTLELRRRAIVD